MSEVDNYADRQDSYTDRYDSESDYDSGKETAYLSVEYTEREEREDTVDLTESEEETINTFERNCLWAN